MQAEDMKQRTFAFGLATIKLVDKLPNTRSAGVIGNQLVRCGTSVGANYRSALRGRSRADFISKIGIALEEADESTYWINILKETKMVSEVEIAPLAKEADELTAILTATCRTAKQNIIRK